jgi:tRNA pseudouridine55 synthase
VTAYNAATEPHGVLVVDKPVGPSSHDVVAVARRSLGISRIGHTGTLDPQASGVLPLVIGQATRLAQYLSGSDKEYEAVIRFGIVTDTHDAAGEVTGESGHVPSQADIDAALPQFTGTFDQTPPLYSAKMVDGERSYVRARAGKPMQAAAVSVTVYELELLSYEAPRAHVRVRCSAGFYVRALAHDLGAAIGAGAILDGLIRTEAAGFRAADAVPFATLAGAPRAELCVAVRPMEALLADVPSAELTEEGLQWARHGRDLGPDQLVAPLPEVPPLVRLIGRDGRLVGLADRGNTSGFLHPAVVFKYN